MNKFKKLMEKRAQNIAQMELLTTTAETEERAMTEEESAQFEALEKEVRAIDATMEAANRARDLDHVEDPSAEEEKRAEEVPTEEAEERAFANYIRGVVEERGTDVNLTKTDGGAVIPESIANKIIEKVYDICPIAQLATRYNVKGTLSIPYYPASVTDTDSGVTTTPNITMDYASEFSALNSTSGKFSSIELQAFLAGVLTKVSKSLINNSQFDIVGFVVARMSENIARWLEKELLVGTVSKISGLSTATQVVTAGAATVVTGDELIDLQETVPDAFQRDSIWIMNRSTRAAIRKLKDKDDNYLLNRDFDARWGYKLLGQDVFVSDNMPGLGANKKAIYYGDMSGLALKVSEELNIEVLRERFATEHAIGVVGYLECDAKIENDQKIAVLQCAASDPEGATGTTE